MFQSQAYEKHQLQYQVLVYIIAGVLVMSCFGVIFMLGFELFRSLRYANFMIKIRKAELEIKKIEHHIVRVRTTTVADSEALKLLKAEADTDLKDRPPLNLRQEAAAWLLALRQFITSKIKHGCDSICSRRDRSQPRQPKVKKYYGKSLIDLQNSRKFPSQKAVNSADPSTESPASVSTTRVRFGEESNPLHRPIQTEPSLWGVFPSSERSKTDANPTLNPVFVRSKDMSKSGFVRTDSHIDVPEDDASSWDVFPESNNSSGESTKRLGHEVNPLHRDSNFAADKRKQFNRSDSTRRTIEKANQELEQARALAKQAEEKQLKAERANLDLAEQLRTRSASRVEAELQMRLSAGLKGHSKEVQAQKQAALVAEKRARESEEAEGRARKRAEELEKRTHEMEERAKATEEEHKQEMKKLTSFRGDVASKAQLFARRRSTRLERKCKHAGECGCSGFVVDIKSKRTGCCVCGHLNSDHTSIGQLQAMEGSSSMERDMLI